MDKYDTDICLVMSMILSILGGLCFSLAVSGVIMLLWAALMLAAYLTSLLAKHPAPKPRPPAHTEN